MKLIVGLGNPGAEYARNRHNIGFMALDRIAEDYGLPPWRKRFRGLVTDGSVDGERVLLLKPGTYMNASGDAVREAAKFHKLKVGDVIVLHDELDLPPGKLRIKTGGGNAGHNGLKSISAQLGNEYVRVRIGIGHPGHKDKVAGYVLHDFAKADGDWIEQLLAAIARRCGHLASGDWARFQSDIAMDLGEAPTQTQASARAGSAGSSRAAGQKRSGAGPKAKGGAPTAKSSGSGAPSQRALARGAAGSGRRKGGSKSKPQPSTTPDAEQQAVAKPSPTTVAGKGGGSTGALADKLKAWLTGRSDKGS